MNRSTWAGRRVLVTGHTGFKGAWLVAWLEHLGADVTGLSLAPCLTGLYQLDSPWQHRSVTADLRYSDMGEILDEVRPEVVFHLAAQSTVRAGYEDPEATWATNVLGTVRLLDALRHVDSARAVVVTTTDKVYGSAQQCFTETDPLVASDPYGGSKVGQEMVVASFRQSYFAPKTELVTARAGNVIGGGDAGANRLIPDAVRAQQAGEALRLRYPDAVRPWQHVLDPLSGYLQYAERALSDDETPPSLNFGPDPADAVTVMELARAFLHQRSSPPTPVVTCDHDPDKEENPHLAIDSSAASDLLGWSPRLSTHEAVSWTAQWYASVERGADPLETTRSQVLRYEALAR